MTDDQFNTPPDVAAAPEPLANSDAHNVDANDADRSVPATQAADPLLLTIGDIGVSRHWVVTPNGSTRLSGTTWIVQDQSRTESRIPSYAIVLAIVFAIACLLGLLFLLIKEQQTTGYVSVTVQSDSLFHVAQVPVSSPDDVARIRGDVNQAQSLAVQDRG
jgi:hypothetical protein